MTEYLIIAAALAVGAILGISAGVEWAKEDKEEECQQEPIAATPCRSSIMDKVSQRQDSTRQQMMDVMAHANRMGCYDAADIIRHILNAPPWESIIKEPLPVLADKAGYWTNTSSNGKIWRIWLGLKDHREINLKPEVAFEDLSYCAVDGHARAHLARIMKPKIIN